MIERLADLATAIFLSCVFCWLICGPHRPRWQRALFIVAFTVLAMGYREVAVWQRRAMTGEDLARVDWQGVTDDELMAWNCGFASGANMVAKPFDACRKYTGLFHK